jgi:hypothetical protein
MVLATLLATSALIGFFLAALFLGGVFCLQSALGRATMSGVGGWAGGGRPDRGVGCGPIRLLTRRSGPGLPRRLVVVREVKPGGPVLGRVVMTGSLPFC